MTFDFFIELENLYTESSIYKCRVRVSIGMYVHSTRQLNAQHQL